MAMAMVCAFQVTARNARGQDILGHHEQVHLLAPTCVVISITTPATTFVQMAMRPGNSRPAGTPRHS
jgi:hypothetical protein